MRYMTRADVEFDIFAENFLEIANWKKSFVVLTFNNQVIFIPQH